MLAALFQNSNWKENLPRETVSSCSYYRNHDYTDPSHSIHLKPHHCLGLLDERNYTSPFLYTVQLHYAWLLLYLHTFTHSQVVVLPQLWSIVSSSCAWGVCGMGLHKYRSYTLVLKPIWLWKCFTIHTTDSGGYLPCVAVMSKSRHTYLSYLWLKPVHHTAFALVSFFNTLLYTYILVWW